MTRLTMAITAAIVTAALYVARAVHRFEVSWPAEICTAPGTQQRLAAGGAPALPAVASTSPPRVQVQPEIGTKATAPVPCTPSRRELDLLQRHLLCRATQVHDPDEAGERCRDCTKLLGPDDVVCSTAPFLDWARRVA